MEKKQRSVALLSAGLLVGGAAAGVLVVSAANAATAGPSLTASSTSSAGESSTGTSGSTGEGRQGHGHRFAPGQGSNPDEKAVSSTIAARLKAAALKAVPGGTVLRVETDAGDAVYEAHMKKADGSFVTVKFDKAYAVTAVEDGMGKGDPQSGRHGGHDGQRQSGGSGASDSPGA
jgi:hypothetical protein